MKTTENGRILVVDDDERIRRTLKVMLTSVGYEVRCAVTAEETLQIVGEWVPDLLIIDIILPGMNGNELTRELRTWLDAPILFLSARNRDIDKVAAFDLGADDYLTKPFSGVELQARIRALLRRVPTQDTHAHRITTPDLTVDLTQRRVTRDGQDIHLTPTEYQILALLVGSPNRAFTSQELQAHLWGADSDDDVHLLRVHISNLRKKIEPDPTQPRYILTEPSLGFRFVLPE